MVVVNADALTPTTSRKEACSYMLKRLEPIVQQVLLFRLTASCTAAQRCSPSTWGLLCSRAVLVCCLHGAGRCAAAECSL